MNLNLDLDALGYRWKGTYNAATTYKDNDVVYKDGGAYVIRNGAPVAFALGQQDVILKGHLLTGGVSVGGAGGMALHMNAAGDGVEFRYSSDRNGTVATSLLQATDDSGPKQYASQHYMGAVMSDGSVRMWGYANGGQTGSQAADQARLVPQRVAFPPGSPRISKVVSCWTNTYYLDVNGGLWFSGYNSGNVMSGYGATGAVPVPVLINGNGTNNSITSTTKIADVFVGKDWGSAMSVMAVDTSGRVHAWGYNASGQLGLGNTTDQGTARLVPFTASTPIKSIFIAGGYYGVTALIDYNGYAYISGNSSLNFLSANTSVHQEIDAGGQKIKKVVWSTSDTHATAGDQPTWVGAIVCENGNVYMNHDGTVSGTGIGQGLWGAIGQAPLSSSPFATNCDDFYMIHGGYPRAFALKKDGTVQMRGHVYFNTDGGTNDTHYPNWTTIGGTTLTNITKLRVLAGQHSTILGALRSDGRLVVWGKTPEGQRGTGDAGTTSGFGYVQSDRPIVDFQFSGSIWTEGTTYFTTVHALTDQGQVLSWGSNYYFVNGQFPQAHSATPHIIRF